LLYCLVDSEDLELLFGVYRAGTRSLSSLLMVSRVYSQVLQSSAPLDISLSHSERRSTRSLHQVHGRFSLLCFARVS